MVCEIGYRSVSRAQVVKPEVRSRVVRPNSSSEPKAAGPDVDYLTLPDGSTVERRHTIRNCQKDVLEFQTRTAPPQIDEELLQNFGQDSPEFLEWLRGLDTGPVLREALARAKRALRTRVDVEFWVERGGLAARATFRNPKEKAAAEAVVAAFGTRWQVEVLGIVASCLGFEVALEYQSAGERGLLVLEGEKPSPSSVREYLKVTVDASGATELRFEHFASLASLEFEEKRLVTLSRLFGVGLVVHETQRTGSPIPAGAVHAHSTLKAESKTCLLEAPSFDPFGGLFQKAPRETVPSCEEALPHPGKERGRSQEKRDSSG